MSGEGIGTPPPKGTDLGYWGDGGKRGWFDDRGKWFGPVSGGGGAVQSVLEGVRQMGGLMIVAFVTPVTASRGSGTSATSLRFEALRAGLKNKQSRRRKS